MYFLENEKAVARQDERGRIGFYSNTVFQSNWVLNAVRVKEHVELSLHHHIKVFSYYYS